MDRSHGIFDQSIGFGASGFMWVPAGVVFGVPKSLRTDFLRQGASLQISTCSFCERKVKSNIMLLKIVCRDI